MALVQVCSGVCTFFVQQLIDLLTGLVSHAIRINRVVELPQFIIEYHKPVKTSRIAACSFLSLRPIPK